VAGVGVSAALVGLVHLFWLGPARAGIAVHEQALSIVRGDIARAAVVERTLPALQRLHDALTVHSAALHAGRSGEPSVPGLLRDVEEMADESGLWITGFKPGSPVIREALTEWSVALEFEGTYAGLVQFLQAASDHPRLVTVTGLRLRTHQQPVEDLTLAGSCRLTTYVPVDMGAGAVATQPVVTAAIADGQRVHQGVP
jgi:Tfp pilus assembly protein PilO